ncbi:TPA: penicillin-binding protein 1C, partial [Kluyvera ascorbata]|nr:penicillin-binding protein 1C [Kluyvera ascorbata]
DVWPLPLEPWLPAGERRAARLPPVSTSCPPRQLQNAAPLMLSGIREDAVIRRLPGEPSAKVVLQASGGEGRRWWFLNGEPQASAGDSLTLMLIDPAAYQLVVMDEAGQTSVVNFTLQ